ncbi:flagellar basal body L-ring protein FlgH [Sulfurivermis fontis]|uniref:flagellar basal body L-ring protein FlgH n=1 Tax=Sulfurivermis fontis TaxID=1972068 RepID=UPI000FDAC423|nr:flagellar basal body L-ring protein FlgH [Sulfurivermis fontis]
MKTLLAIIASVTALSGCATIDPPARDPAYAPTMPVAPVSAQDNNGAIYQPVNGLALFEDVRAHRVGDILTVQLVEKTNASKKAATSTSKDQDISLGVTDVFGGPVSVNGRNPLTASVSGSRDFSGDGASSQSNTLTGNISVTIAEVLPNGNMIVRGEKVLTINQGDEFIRIAGIVRPVDVSPDNTVLSTKIANAEITYGGRGTLADSNRKGWLARFFDSPLWPF